ncbi:MAG: DUF4332 domain-containing protein [Planctomycetota bacterium]|jgi:predicted flap endonuclease-1-like 5' DNA nuclease
MCYSLKEVEGIGPSHKERLSAARIRTTRDFLRFCCHETGRLSVSEITGLDPALLLKWANQADLMRITGIGPQFVELLEAAGVHKVGELKDKDPETLTARMRELNRTLRLTRNVPPLRLVRAWVTQAQTLEPAVTNGV